MLKTFFRGGRVHSSDYDRLQHERSAHLILDFDRHAHFQRFTKPTEIVVKQRYRIIVRLHTRGGGEIGITPPAPDLVIAR